MIKDGRMEISDSAKIRFHENPASASIDSLTKIASGYFAGVFT